MSESLLQWDRDMMVFLNAGGAHQPGLDFFFWMCSQLWVWLPVLMVFVYTVVKSRRREAFLVFGLVVVLFLCCDQISSSLFKPWVARLRPSRDPLVMDMLRYVYDYRGGMFGFPSSHAANSFGFALFSSLLIRDRLYTVVSLLWAAMCAYSRVYLGVHFPFDILCGAVLGVLVALMCYGIFLWLRGRFPSFASPLPESYDEWTEGGYMKSGIRLLVWTLLVTFFIFFCGGLSIR